jgi:hypothetical protein
VSKRWVLLLVTVPVLLIGTYTQAIRLARTNPPVSTCGGATNLVNGQPTMGLDLCNDSRWPLYLQEAYVEEDRQARVTPYLSFAQETTVIMASNVALAPERHPHQTGEIDGWVLAPTELGRLHDRHALRVEPAQTPSGDQTLVVRYKYLGWPMALRTTISWPK